MHDTDNKLADEILVVAAIVGDLSAFDCLVNRYRAATVRLARSLVGRQDAEDVAQDAFLLAFKALPSIEEPARFAPWLRAITRRRALRFKSREAREPARADMDEILLEQLPALRTPIYEDKEAEAALGQALDKLPK